VHAEAVTDAQLLELREAREALGATDVEVVEGSLRGATLFIFDSVVEDAVFVGREGEPWSGTLSVAPGGEIDMQGDGKPPVVEGNALLTSAPLTARAFKLGLPGRWGSWIVTIAVVLFAVSTGISWSYYGDRATEYVLGSWAIPYYRWVFVFFFFMGAILPLKAVWTAGDVALGIMSFPNLIAVILLSGQVARMTKDYLSRPHKRFR
jgi:AGCS family alanine or glycine:cation symporter